MRANFAATEGDRKELLDRFDYIHEELDGGLLEINRAFRRQADLGFRVTPDTFGYAVWKLTVAQVAPVLPFVLLVVILIVRPRGLMGTREN